MIQQYTGKKNIFVLFILFITGFIILNTGCFSNKSGKKNYLVNKKLNNKKKIDARIYKIAGKQNLELHIFYPDNYNKLRKEPYPVSICFGGGGWVEGPIEWSYDGAEIMLKYDMIGVAVYYRRADYRNISVLDAMKDANSSIRWVRMNAEELNIDTEKVLAFGYSAGAHLAISAAMFPHFKEESEDSSISSVPDAIIAVVPPVSLTQDSYFQNLLINQEKAKNCSPIDNIKPGIAPIYIICGTEDEILPLKYTQQFYKDMNKAGNKVFLYLYPGGKHGFFYEDPEGEKFYKECVSDAAAKLNWVN